MSETNTLIEQPMMPAMGIQELQRQVALIDQALGAVMKKKVHYDIIPGTDKPCLLKPGAEKICLLFQLSPEIEVKEKELADGHREYSVTCRLIHRGTGILAGAGIGLCTTMESKYRYRHADAVDTGILVPKIYWDAKNSGDVMEMTRVLGKGNSAKKNATGMWTIHKRGEGKVENPDIADVYNTVLKMAKKRAHVDATLTATAASDMFFQDLEDMPQFQQKQGSGAVSAGGGPPPPSTPVDEPQAAPAPIPDGLDDPPEMTVDQPQGQRGPLPYDLPPKGDDLRLDFVKWVDIQVQEGCLEEAWKLKQEDWKGRCIGRQSGMLFVIYKKALDNMEPEGQPQPEGPDDNRDVPF